VKVGEMESGHPVEYVRITIEWPEGSKKTEVPADAPVGKLADVLAGRFGLDAGKKYCLRARDSGDILDDNAAIGDAGLAEWADVLIEEKPDIVRLTSGDFSVEEAEQDPDRIVITATDVSQAAPAAAGAVTPAVREDRGGGEVASRVVSQKLALMLKSPEAKIQAVVLAGAVLGGISVFLPWVSTPFGWTACPDGAFGALLFIGAVAAGVLASVSLASGNLPGAFVKAQASIGSGGFTYVIYKIIRFYSTDFGTSGLSGFGLGDFMWLGPGIWLTLVGFAAVGVCAGIVLRNRAKAARQRQI
jgi:hypothetical protein